MPLPVNIESLIDNQKEGKLYGMKVFPNKKRVAKLATLFRPGTPQSKRTLRFRCKNTTEKLITQENF